MRAEEKKVIDTLKKNFDDDIKFYLDSEGYIYEISLFGRSVKEIPEILLELTHLKMLNLGQTDLHEIPDWIDKFKNLREISLDKNNIETIPNSLVNMQKLEILELSSNNISYLNSIIYQLPNLVWLQIDKNPLIVPPYTVCAQGIDSIRRYFKTIDLRKKEFKNLIETKEKILIHTIVKQFDFSRSEFFYWIFQWQREIPVILKNDTINQYKIEIEEKNIIYDLDQINKELPEFEPFNDKLRKILSNFFIRLSSNIVDQGSEGWILQGRDIADQKVAIKIYKHLKDLEKNFEKIPELSLLMTINHKNIIKINFPFEIPFNNENYIGVVMEWIEGKTFDKVLPNIRDLPFEEKNVIIVELIDTLIVLNRKLAKHRDLHERNILFDSQRVVLIDPGNPSDILINEESSISQYNRNFLKSIFNQIYTNSQKRKIRENWDSLASIRESFLHLEDRNGSLINFQEIFDELKDIIAKIYFYVGTINPQTNLFTGLDRSQFTNFGISVEPSGKVFLFFSNLYSLDLTYLFDPEKVANQQQLSPLRINREGIPNNITKSKQIIVFLRKLAKDFSRRSSQPIEFAEEKFPTEREIARKLLIDFTQALKDYQPKTLTKIFSHSFKKYYICEYLQLKYTTGADQIWNLWELNLLHYHLGWDQNQLKMSNIETGQLYSGREIPIEWIDEVVSHLLENSNWFHSEIY